MTPDSNWQARSFVLHRSPCVENLHHEYHLQPRITMKERAKPQMEILPLLTPPLPEKQFKPTTLHSQSSGTFFVVVRNRFVTSHPPKAHDYVKKNKNQMESQHYWHQVLT